MPQGSLRSYRFRSYCLGLGAIVALVGGAMVAGVSLEALDAPLGALVTLTLGQLGLGTWHDRGVRMGALGQVPPKAD